MTDEMKAAKHPHVTDLAHSHLKAHSDGRSKLRFPQMFFCKKGFFYFAADICGKHMRLMQTSAENAADCGRLNEPLLT